LILLPFISKKKHLIGRPFVVTGMAGFGRFVFQEVVVEGY